MRVTVRSKVKHHPTTPTPAPRAGWWEQHQKENGVSLHLVAYIWDWHLTDSDVSNLAMAAVNNYRQPNITSLDSWQEAISGVDQCLSTLISSPRGLDRGDRFFARLQKMLKELDDDESGTVRPVLPTSDWMMTSVSSSVNWW